ncbi:hypothetical protein SESBI_08342 [Sesbania bispinosa]|nr:hypothetical protein SESBI_08342 [Sesbania bispinosa]
MDQNDEAIAKSANSLSFPSLKSRRAWLEIRLFYVRISPCVVDSVPDHLTLCHPHREIGVSLVINGSHVPISETPPPLPLRRDRVDRESAEVTYVSTDSVRLTGGADFEVYEKEGLFLCGSLERLDATDWGGGNGSGWTMDCHVAAGSIGSGSSAFFRPKLGVAAPSIEVYVAGCCSGVPVILSKTIQMSPRRRVPRHATLDAIPEDEEMMMEKEHNGRNGLILHPKLQGGQDTYPDKLAMEDVLLVPGDYIHFKSQVPLLKIPVFVSVYPLLTLAFVTSIQIPCSLLDVSIAPIECSHMTGSAVDDYDCDEKMGHGFYSQEMYPGEDGQLSCSMRSSRKCYVGVGSRMGHSWPG